MAFSRSFINSMIGRPAHGGRSRQHRIRSQMMFPRDVVAPARDHRERQAGAEVEDRLDALAEARRRRVAKS